MVSTPVYVVQVTGGREEHVRGLIRQRCGDSLEDCFAPACDVMQKRHGEWQPARKLLFPGYVFVQTSEPEELLKRLRDVNEFCRLLGVTGDSFSALTEDEVAWLDALTDTGTHSMGMSEGVIEGDRVIVTQGPLKGREAHIKRVDRHKRMAYLDVHILGRATQIKVGLEIVRRYESSR